MRRAALSDLLRRALVWYREKPLPLRLLAILVWATMIWLASSKAGGNEPGTLWSSFCNNGAHLVLFGVFGGLVFLALPGDLRMRSAWAVVAALAYGVTDELHQRAVAGRSADPRDVVTDVVGAAWCAATLIWVERRDPRAARVCLWLLPVGLLAAAIATI